MGMTEKSKQEVWQRGPIPGIIPLLQPAAHAIIQAKEDVETIMRLFPEEKLWQKPAGMASVAFHLQHMAGVLDRLFTYAKGNTLSDQQRDYLKQEGAVNAGLDGAALCNRFYQQVDLAIEDLRNWEEQDLLAPKGIGRLQIPTNVIGLLFHAAEHIQRHTGQLLVTCAVVK